MPNTYKASQIVSFLSSKTDDETEKELIPLFSGRYAESLNCLDTYLSVDTSLKILDLGTGSGVMSLLINHFYPQHAITAADVCLEERVRHRLEAKGIDIVTNCKFENSRQLPLETAGYDFCVFVEVFEHIIADPRYVLAEIFRITKPHGLVLLTTPNLAYLHSRLLLLFGIQPQFFLRPDRYGRKLPRNHFREWTMVELVTLVKEAGFEIMDKRFLYGHGYMRTAGKKAYLKLPLLLFNLLLTVQPSFRALMAIIAKKPEQIIKH